MMWRRRPRTVKRGRAAANDAKGEREGRMARRRAGRQWWRRRWWEPGHEDVAAGPYESATPWVTLRWPAGVLIRGEHRRSEKHHRNALRSCLNIYTQLAHKYIYTRVYIYIYTQTYAIYTRARTYFYLHTYKLRVRLLTCKYVRTWIYIYTTE